jgi:hypothetical protein
MASVRSDTVEDGVVATYHCWSECVRRAWLCGRDEETGKDYEHRRGWVEDLAEQFAGLLALEVGFFAVLVNDLQFVLRTRPDLVDQWSDEEVVTRFMRFARLVKSADGRTYEEPTEEEIQERMGDPEKVARYREVLWHPSAFMGGLEESISRRGNREDGCKGHFWADRYGCRRLDTLAAVFLCALYIDLFPIRKGEADTPEASVHTSVYRRIAAQKQRVGQAANSAANPAASPAANPAANPAESPPGKLPDCRLPDGWLPDCRLADCWLAELSFDPRSDALVAQQGASQSGARASDKGFLPVSFATYLETLDWFARQMREGKAGALPQNLAPILERLDLKLEVCQEAIEQFDTLFGRIVGTGAQLARWAAATGRAYLRGAPACRRVFG